MSMPAREQSAYPLIRFLEIIWRSCSWLVTLDFRVEDKFGDEVAYQSLTPILTVVIATAASYALTVNQIPGAETLATVFYSLITIVLCCLVSLVVHTAAAGETVASSSRGRDYRFDKNSLFYGRIISVLSVGLLIVFAFCAKTGAFPGQRPQAVDFAATEIRCQVSLGENPSQTWISTTGTLVDAATEDALLGEQFKNWFGRCGSDPKKEQTLVVVQYPPFETAYNDLSVMMLMRSDVVFVKALPFIRRRLPGAGSGSLRYRLLDWSLQRPRPGDLTAYEMEQLHMPTDQNDFQYPVVMIPKPGPGDSLMFFVRVQAPENQKLKSDLASFGFHLKRVW